MSSIPHDDQIARGMLDAFRQRLIDNLTATAIAAIKPSIVAEATKAVDELQLAVSNHAAMDHFERKVVIALIMKDAEGKTNVLR